MNDHAAAMDAHAYWRQFSSTEDFLEPGTTVSGVIEDLGSLRSGGEFIPRLRIRQPDGSAVTVTAGPKRLLAELKRLCPKVGDHIKIRYLGPEDHSMPGMNPTRRFAVAVRPAGVDPATGEVARSNGNNPTADEGTAVDAPGPDQRTASQPAGVEGPTPPASTDAAAVPGPGPDEPASYIEPNGRVHVPTERPDVTAVKARIAALPTDERPSFWEWLTKAKIPNSIDVSPSKIKAVNAELDRRAAAASPDPGER